ncbi:multi drug resistance protein-like [Trypanosoma conorhini]|uniref:Multi drug resistance protein-like n=1 Tax=Trypanosoma conorhini TaxID=83891 RepID=A0A422Q834_9TRYP|nr:multi drug resistance protein-like [Trypanosoma conorhini]RNF26133.1 multi drug resistance protein-like [Trypanosoma conorhini]
MRTAATPGPPPPRRGAGAGAGAGAGEESSECLLGPTSPRRGRRSTVGLRLRNALRRFLRSYRMQSYVSLTFAVAYHLMHLLLLVAAIASPLTVRSLLFRDEYNAHYALTARDTSGTRCVGVWTVHAFELPRNELQGGRVPWSQPQCEAGQPTTNTTSGDFLRMWEASPLSLLTYYYSYLICSFCVVACLTRGRLSGYVALLQLVFGGLELLWYIRHNSFSFTLFFWLAALSPQFPRPWVPFAKRHPGGGVTFHVFNRSGVESASPPQQVELTPAEYMLPYTATLEATVFRVTVVFLVILTACFVLNFQRVLDAVVGVRALAVADGHRRCPLCGEEWDIATETAERPASVNDNSRTDEKEKRTAGGTLVGAAVVTAMPLPVLPRPADRHRCRRLFNDGEASSGVFDTTGYGSTDLELFGTDDDDDDEGDEVEEGVVGAQQVGAARARLPPTSAGRPPAQKPRRRRLNRSFSQLPSYGTMGTNEPEEGRPPYDPFSGREDEFRPGNAFPSLEDAGWAARWTYSWLTPLMSFSAIDSEVLHHERFLPSLPEGFTALQNIATPAWQLWVNRWRWFGKARGGEEREGPDIGGAHGEDGDGSSDDGTFVTIRQHRPLTGAKLRPRRPRRSFWMSSFLFFTAPLRWALRKAFVSIFLSEKRGTEASESDEVDDKKVDRRGGSNSMRRRSTVSALLDAAIKLRSNLFSTDVGLFTLFLEHRSGRRFMYSCVPLRLISDALILSTSAIVYHLTLAIERESLEGVMHPIGVCGILFLVLLGHAVLRQEYISQLYLSALEVGTAIRALVLEKSLALPLAQRTLTKGEVIHLITVDASRCSQTLMQLHQSWRCPCFAAASFYILHMHVGLLPTLAALLIIIIATPLQRVTGGEVQAAQRRCTSRTADRVELVGEALASMRQVKAMGAEHLYLRGIHLARQTETKDEVGAMEATTRSAWLADGIGVALASACYTAYYLTGGSLTARVVVPALVALNLLRGVVNEWPAVVAAIPRGFASLRRIEAYLQQAPDEFLGTWVDVTADWSHRRGTVICHGCSFTWQDDAARGPPTPVLRDVNMFLRPRELVVVQGPLGSGKSTLLLAILGEVNRCCTTATLAAAAAGDKTPTEPAPGGAAAGVCVAPFSPNVATQAARAQFDAAQPSTDGFAVFGRSAYCSETPWLQNDTIRANIILSSVYNARWYHAVTQACALHEDFATLAKGDESVVGAKGVQLSAGQRVRVALARALYSRADVYVLDNILASLDARLQAHIIDRVFHGILRNRTVILATYVGLARLKPKRFFTLHHDGTVVEAAAAAAAAGRRRRRRRRRRRSGRRICMRRSARSQRWPASVSSMRKTPTRMRRTAAVPPLASAKRTVWGATTLSREPPTCDASSPLWAPAYFGLCSPVWHSTCCRWAKTCG